MAIAKIGNVSAGSLKDPKMVVTRETDPDFFINFGLLPNPDTILAKMGKDQSIYTAMQYDSHIMGELRSLRSGLLGYERRLVIGADDPESRRAFDLIRQRMEKRPVNGLRWDDFIWNIYTAVLNGQSIHELAMYKTDDGFILPAIMVDRPVRRFRYNLKNELKFLTKNSPLFGEDAPDDYRFLVTKHMPSHENPYGVAVMSSIFWPYVFKRGGMKWLAKLAEKWGVPFLIGRYPVGSDLKVANELAQQLQNMVEDAVAAVPEGSGIEALESKISGDPVQERLINLCNREISKALTSQTLGTEIQGSGSRAAAETHKDRQNDVAESDRNMVCSTVNQLFEWITELNFKNAVAPEYEFYQESAAPKDWSEVLEKANSKVEIPKSFYYKIMKIPPPEDGEEVIAISAAPASVPGTEQGQFARANPTLLTGMGVDDMLEPVEKLMKRMDKEGKSLEDFHDALFTLYPDIDDKSIGEFMVMALTGEYLQGMVVEDR